MNLIDCLGLLSKIVRLSISFDHIVCCVSTSFPEAIPLRNTKTKTIVKFFTIVGLPRSVQSDQGSNFMSGIFQQVMY